MTVNLEINFQTQTSQQASISEMEFTCKSLTERYFAVK